jgi:hypothetical protein
MPDQVEGGEVVTVHILCPPTVDRRVLWQDCPDCKKRSPIAYLFYEWYGPNGTCMRCGREYNEEGWVRAPLMRGWRDLNKRNMRRAWKRAAPTKEEA